MSDQRILINSRLIGVMQKDTKKMFMISVLWSDQSEIIVYRSFQEFKKLHKRLKKKFCPETLFRRSDRIFPKFGGRNITKNFQKSSPNKSVLRLKVLEKYCSELLACDPSIVQCAEVIQFFLPQHQDLQPDYAKNCIVILPSEGLSESTGTRAVYSDGKRHSMGNVTPPFVMQTYRCVAPYETKDTKNRPFKVAVAETVDVLIKDKAGWWLVENEEKRLAWFPAPYLERCEEEETDDPEQCSTPVEGMLYCAVRSCTAKKDDEVSVNIGSVVEVLQKSDDGWWLIRYHGKVGYMPSMYLQPYFNPHMRFQTLQNEMYSSSLNLAQMLFPKPGDSSPSQHKATHPQEKQRQHPTHKPWGNHLKPLNKQKSHSLELLSPVAAEPEVRKGSLSEGSESSFSDEEEPHRSATPVDPARDQPSSPLEEKLAENGSPVPKVPPRPRAQEILSRCTTMTRMAALTHKAQLLPELGQVLSR